MDDKNLKVGLTLFVGLVIFFLFIFFVGSSGNYFKSTYKLKIFVQDVQGLAEGNLVSLGGIKIGAVKKIGFKTNNNISGIVIDMEIFSKYQKQITTNSIAEIKTIGLLGDKFVDIKLGITNDESLKNNSYIKYEKSLTLSEVSKDLEPALNDFAKVMKNLRIISDSVSKGKGSLGELFTNQKISNDIKSLIYELKLFTTSLNSKKSTLSKLAYNDSLYNKLVSLTNNFDKISQSISDGKGSMGKFITSDSLYNNLNKLTINLNEIGKKLNSENSIAGGIINNKKMYLNFQKLIKDTDSLFTDLKNNPERYIQFSIF